MLIIDKKARCKSELRVFDYMYCLSFLQLSFDGLGDES